ncbi:hypothetical protein T10_4268 [Trichinella papuae]|uniref:Uncharacterized protein n=1 Tax=Trichinella papuae TaxID=268474 RepID=A0A0V1MB98_9BILA|nr:hypothetical protein T10_5923 [Trichinella papuae]KRZ77780.1 hypothetical protein T10_4268 [Trichinella papuae]
MPFCPVNWCQQFVVHVRLLFLACAIADYEAQHSPPPGNHLKKLSTTTATLGQPAQISGDGLSKDVLLSISSDKSCRTDLMLTVRLDKNGELLFQRVRRVQYTIPSILSDHDKHRR